MIFNSFMLTSIVSNGQHCCRVSFWPDRLVGLPLSSKGLFSRRGLAFPFFYLKMEKNTKRWKNDLKWKMKTNENFINFQIFLWSKFFSILYCCPLCALPPHHRFIIDNCLMSYKLHFQQQSHFNAILSLLNYNWT